MMLAWFNSSERMKSSFPRIERDGAGVRGEAGLEDDAGLNVLEGGDLLFELHVDAHGAGDGADGAGAYAMLADGCDGGFFEFGVVAETEVVVAGEVDDFAAVVGADGGLNVVELAELEVGSAALEFVELGGEMGELRAGGHEFHRTLPPGGWLEYERGSEWIGADVA